jgi:hypothetical protein
MRRPEARGQRSEVNHERLRLNLSVCTGGHTLNTEYQGVIEKV